MGGEGVMTFLDLHMLFMIRRKSIRNVRTDRFQEDISCAVYANTIRFIHCFKIFLHFIVYGLLGTVNQVPYC